MFMTALKARPPSSESAPGYLNGHINSAGEVALAEDAASATGEAVQDVEVEPPKRISRHYSRRGIGIGGHE